MKTNCSNIRKLHLLFTTFFLAISLSAETPTESRLLKLENKAALRELVDTFAVLADKKDVMAQIQLFTEDAVVETHRDNGMVSKLEGRNQIGEAFAGFLSNFKTVYHFNGQHLVSINGDKANGELYCLTTLIAEDGAKISFGIRYEDEYILREERWLIARRVSHFEWEDSLAADR